MCEVNYNIQIDKLCHNLQLGDITAEPQALSGGLLHKMFDVHTTKDRYAVKALNPLIMKRPPAKQNVIDSEIIASIAAKHIPAAAAIKFGGNALQELDNQYYLIFKWVDGRSLKQDEIRPDHCLKMGVLLGNLHWVDFSESGIENQNTCEEKQIDWSSFLKKGQEQGAEWAGLLCDSLNQLNDWLKRYNISAKKLMRGQLISHKDMDSKNVLWQHDEPLIIDWEAAGYINPMKDLVETALYFAEDLNGAIDKNRLLAFIDGYKQITGKFYADWDAVLDNSFIGRLEWLEYSLKRSLNLECSSKDEQQMGTEQTVSTLKALTQYSEMIPKIKAWIEESE